MSKKKFKDSELRLVATGWLDASIIAMGTLGNNIHAVYLGSLLFIHDRPMTISELARYEFVGSRRSASRWAHQLIDRGVAKKTEAGIEITELGRETGRYFFGILANLQESIKKACKLDNKSKAVLLKREKGK